MALNRWLKDIEANPVDRRPRASAARVTLLVQQERAVDTYLQTLFTCPSPSSRNDPLCPPLRHQKKYLHCTIILLI
jgi:hypothetical protein